jgi:hypothetical protein
MLRQLALVSFILFTPSLVSAQTAKFQLQKADIEKWWPIIKAAGIKGE